MFAKKLNQKKYKAKEHVDRQFIYLSNRRQSVCQKITNYKQSTERVQQNGPFEILHIHQNFAILRNLKTN